MTSYNIAVILLALVPGEKMTAWHVQLFFFIQMTLFVEIKSKQLS